MIVEYSGARPACFDKLQERKSQLFCRIKPFALSRAEG